MSLTKDISGYLSIPRGKLPLFAVASLEWHVELGRAARGIIVFWSDRSLTPDGGDGWNGLDAADMLQLDKAVQQYVDDYGANMIKGFIVRNRRGILPPT